MKRNPLHRIVSKLVIGLALLIVVFAGLGLILVRRGLPQREGSAELAALVHPVTVRFDRWGVPFLKAASLEDAWRAQGWLHANDRALQMELVRRSALGELAELFGERALKHDRRQRQLGFRWLADRMARELSFESRRGLEAYAEGVNAWYRSRASDLPPGFLLLFHRPRPWTVQDSMALVLLMAQQLSEVTSQSENELFELLRGLGPELAKGLAGAPDAVLFPEILELSRTLRPRPQQLDLRAEGAGLGSNNWVVAPSRSASGSALLANDPHLGIELPNVWYQIGIHTAEYAASGMSLPGLPGIVLGRGEALAWAMTNLYVDDVDVFYETVDATGTRVQRGESWVAIETVEEVIRVKGAEDVRVFLRWTDRGLFQEEDRERGLPPRSVAWTGHFGGDQLAAMLRLAQCRSVSEVRDAIELWGFPLQNLVVADREGQILWTPIGRAPDRYGWDGRFPAPGASTAVGWRGVRPAAENPSLLDPPSAQIATANSFPPTTVPEWLQGNFDTPYRSDRIREVLESRNDWTVEALAALQGDVVSLWGRQWAHWLAEEPPFSGEAEQARAALAAWNGEMAVRGPAALFALFERWIQRLTFDDDARSAGLPRIGSRWRLLRLMTGVAPPTLWDDRSTSDQVETRREILERALASAWREGAQRFGPELERWNYGVLHQLVLEHPLGRFALLRGLVNRGPYRLPGSATTVFALGGPWRGDRIDVVYGPSMRFVTDAANPDRTLAGIPGGQSGHPWDRHYDDQIEAFLRGELHPAPWSEDAIRRATVRILELRPSTFQP